MAITCPRCHAQYDVTLFAFGRTVKCDCGQVIQWEQGHVEQRTGEREVGGAERRVPDGDERTMGGDSTKG